MFASAWRTTKQGNQIQQARNCGRTQEKTSQTHASSRWAELYSGILGPGYLNHTLNSAGRRLKMFGEIMHDLTVAGGSEYVNKPRTENIESRFDS
jgi:hypothetical protein